MNSREPFAYVVTVEGPSVRLNLQDAHRGHVASHSDGITTVTEIGGLFGVDGGTRLLLMRVRSLSFAEPREAHRAGVGTSVSAGEPLRHLEATVVGTISRRNGALVFTPDSLVSPALGAEAYPLCHDELACVLRSELHAATEVCLGRDVRGGGALTCGITQLLSRHVAVLGSTGQGKSCFTAAVLQQMLHLPAPRIVVFDINGEYGDALRAHAGDGFEQTTLGGQHSTYKIPYYALGRHGLSRLLLPSEKTQRPALTFALERLRNVQWFEDQKAAGLVGTKSPTLFDDCRPGDATEAGKAIEILRRGGATLAEAWPDMGALGCLVAESHSLKQGRNAGSYERDAFQYNNVAPLINRIRRCIEDPLFTSVVSVDGGRPCGERLSWLDEGTAVCDRIFGASDATWKVHVIDLRNVAHDLMPLVLGSLLELLAFELFRRGQQASYPTLLVLEEAHHYLRQVADGGDDGGRSSLAYERLAKEGRKFGLSVWLSTQRPSEISPTVLAQCGTWAVFRLTSDQDLRAVGAAGEWVDRQELARVAGLPRQQAIVFGSSVTMPVRVVAPVADPRPRSSDPDFERWGLERSGDGASSVAEVANPPVLQPPRPKRMPSSIPPPAGATTGVES
ncbi:MAG: ATP-binding protein [Deltaproteobacteria bacterium]|nr:ATP-binding protein [Deltaproteobacteria bacterium]